MRTIRSLLTITLLLLVSTASIAQDYPSKAIRLIVPFPPGGSTDLVARVVGQKMADSWGKQVVIDNRPGANGMIGSDIVAKANPDGYTIVLGTIGPMAINASLYKMPYDILKDLAPITYTANIANVLVVNPTLAAKDVRELIALARTRPGQLTFGSSGTGGAPHMAVELFKLLAKVNIVHVPYKGGGPSVTATIGGEVQFSIPVMGSAATHVKAGRLKMLAVTGAKRSQAFPEVPTVQEAGVPGYVFEAWFGIFSPAGIPKPILNRLNAATHKALAMGDVREQFLRQGIEADPSTPAELTRVLRDDTATWAKIIKSAGIPIN